MENRLQLMGMAVILYLVGLLLYDMAEGFKGIVIYNVLLVVCFVSVKAVLSFIHKRKEGSDEFVS